MAGIVLLVAAPVLMADSEPLTSLKNVMALPYPRAGDSLPVQVDATVTYLDLHFGGGFVDDGEQGIYLRLPKSYRTNETLLHVGDRIRLKAFTCLGDYTPVLTNESLTIVGVGPMPKPILVTPENLFSPNLDSQWVQANGTIVNLEMEGRRQFIFTFEMYGWTIKVVVPWSLEANSEAAALLQRRVTLQGVVATTFNGQRQMTGRFVCVPSLKFIQIQNNQDNTGSQPVLTPMNHLLRCDATPDDLVKVRGTVTYSVKNEIFLRGQESSLRVLLAGGGQFNPGDIVVADGYASVVPFSPIFRARQAAEIGRMAVPPPKKLPNGPLNASNLGNLQMELISTEAEFLGANDSRDETILHCRLNRSDNDFIFEARLPKPYALPTKLVPNCLVQLTGICELSTTHQMPRAEWVDGFKLILREPADVQILRQPSWWTPKRLIDALAICIGLIIIAQIWIWVLRRQVSFQTKIIGTKIERESVLNERQRIARDLHDTLEQQLAGVRFQLSFAEEQLVSNPKQAEVALRLARKMVSYCSDETNHTVRDLRSVLLEERGLVGALREALPLLTNAGEARLVFGLQGTPVRLDGVVETHLLHLAQEAVANAVKHAAAAEIQVTISYSPESVVLIIRDNGRGFDMNAKPLAGHFGLIGMQERVSKINGAFAVESTAGKGTAIRITISNAVDQGPQKHSENHEED